VFGVAPLPFEGAAHAIVTGCSPLTVDVNVSKGFVPLQAASRVVLAVSSQLRALAVNDSVPGAGSPCVVDAPGDFDDFGPLPANVALAPNLPFHALSVNVTRLVRPNGQARVEAMGAFSASQLEACGGVLAFPQVLLRGVAWHGVAWRCVAWRGVAWCGVAGRGVAWHIATFSTPIPLHVQSVLPDPSSYCTTDGMALSQSECHRLLCRRRWWLVQPSFESRTCCRRPRTLTSPFRLRLRTCIMLWLLLTLVPFWLSRGCEGQVFVGHLCR
jgi:hypothetical protein